MFFDDPVSAFGNLRRALAPGGSAAFVCWQGLEANEWVSVVGRVVAQHAALPARRARPWAGHVRAEKPDETAALLDAAGFTKIEIDPISPTVLLAGGGTLDESVDFLLGMGIARGLLGRVEADARDAAIRTIRNSLAERYEPGAGVRLGTGAWLVSANN